jgi:hypothetical protein
MSEYIIQNINKLTHKDKKKILKIICNDISINYITDSADGVRIIMDGLQDSTINIIFNEVANKS